MKISNKLWRVCIADSDVLLFAKGIAGGKNLNVDIKEANIDTLAIQGPKSQNIMKKVFGEKILDLKFFNYDYYKFKGSKYLISKSGYSKQGGYEIHIEDTKNGLKLYDYFFEVGKEFNLKPGMPNLIERIEGALLSYGNDIDNGDNPYECGFDKYINIESEITFLGKEELKKIRSKGVSRKLMGAKIDTDNINLTQEEKLYDNNKNEVGVLRSAAFSPNFKKVIGIAMINKDFWNMTEKFEIIINGSVKSGKICELPIL